MANRSYLTFPASEQKAAIDSVLYAVAKYVVGKFPQRVIRQLFVDTQDSMRDFYKNALTSYGGGVSNTSNQNEELLKTPRPHLFVGYSTPDSYDVDQNGLGELQPYMLPNAFWFQNSMQSQHPIFHDTDRDIYIATNNLRIKITAEFVITCQAREEQLTIYNYILNYLKMYYQMPLEGIEASFILPTYLMRYIKDIMYGENTPYKDIQDEMDFYMKKWSNGGIYPVYRNNKLDDKFYELKYTYHRIDFKMTGKPQLDEGTKTNDAADNFTIRFPASIEFYIPTNYTIRSPDLIINGNGNVFEVPDAIKMDEVVNNEIESHVQTVIKVHEDTLQIPKYIKESGYKPILSQEFAISMPNDQFSIYDIIENKKDLQICFHCLTEQEIKDNFKFCLFEGNNILEEGEDYTVDNGLYSIKNGNMIKIFTFQIWCNMFNLKQLINKKYS